MVVRYLIRQLRQNDISLSSSLVYESTVVDEAQAIAWGYDPELMSDAFAEFNERIARLWNPDT